MATVKELQVQAADLDITGRSDMKKDELVKAIKKAERKADSNKQAAPATKTPDVAEPIAKPDPTPEAEQTDGGGDLPFSFMDEVHPTHQGRPVLVAQALLGMHGYQLGALDGIAGREFARAVRQFRSDRGLPDGDRIDSDVWVELTRSTS